MIPVVTHAAPKPIVGKVRPGGLVSDQTYKPPAPRKRWWQLGRR